MLLAAIATAAVPLAESMAVENCGKQLTQFYLMPCSFLIELNFLSPSANCKTRTTICIKSSNSKACAKALGRECLLNLKRFKKQINILFQGISINERSNRKKQGWINGGYYITASEIGRWGLVGKYYTVCKHRILRLPPIWV